MLAGSGPPRMPVSRASMAPTSSSVSWKSKMSMFSAMRCGLTDFGIAQKPCSMCQRRTTCAGVLPCLRRQLGDDSLLEDGRVLRAVGVDAADRRPGLGCDAALRHQAAQLRLAEVGVHLDLVDGRDDVDLAEQVLQVILHEVCDADCARAAGGQHLLDRLVCADGVVELARHRVVQQEEVDVVDAEPPQAAVEADECLVVAVVVDPELGDDQPLIAPRSCSGRSPSS